MSVKQKVMEAIKKWLTHVFWTDYLADMQELKKHITSEVAEQYDGVVSRVRGDYINMRTDIDYLMSKLNQSPNAEPVKGCRCIDTEPIKKPVARKKIHRNR